MDTERAGGHPAPLVVIVGAGIAGLAAAWELVTASRPGRQPLRVLVLDGAARVGGKLALADLGGHLVDVGAESMLDRRPEARLLAEQVGLGADLQPPRAVGAGIWTRGARVPLPSGTLMGVPSGAAGLTGLLSPAEIDRVQREPEQNWAPSAEHDVSVAAFVAQRVGPAVVDRLVEPLLGGVYAGQAARLSLRATVPALWTTAAAGTSVVAAAARAAAAGTATQSPVFTGLRGGVGRLPLVVRDALLGKGVTVQAGSTVRRLLRDGAGWRLVHGPTTDEQVLAAEAVVLATPAGATSRLLHTVAPVAAAALGEIPTASVAIVTLLLQRSAVHGLQGSGVLVPPVDGKYIKAATFSSSKWSWLDDSLPEHIVLRASVGRYAEQHDLQFDDATVVRRVLTDLRSLPGVRLPDPCATLVTRWGGGLPQYEVGHLGRVARARADVALLPGLALAGAAYDGVGIPACIGSGRRAAREVLAQLDSVG